MFNVGDTVMYKGHGLVKIVGKARKNFDGIDEDYYVLRSARSPMVQTKMMVKASGAEKVLRYPMSADEAKGIIELLGETPAELPDDPKERMQILDEVLERNDVREFATLVKDYRESVLLNFERSEIKRIKAISRNLAEELCYVLKTNRASLRGKLFVKPAG